MAKKIKAIKCPQCGSGEAQLLRIDYYKCKNCGTEYILDDEDININIRHHQTAPNLSVETPALLKRIIWIFGGVFGFIILFSIINGLFISKKTSNALESISKERYDVHQTGMYKGYDDKLYAWYIADNENAGEKTKNSYFLVYDGATGKRISKSELNFKYDRNTGNDKVFTDGSAFITKTNRLFTIDRRTHNLKEITPNELAKFPMLSKGFSDISIGHYHNSIKIETNDGKTFYYFPIADQVLSDNQGHGNISEKLEQFEKPYKNQNQKYMYFEVVRQDFSDFQILLRYYSTTPPHVPHDNIYFDFRNDIIKPRFSSIKSSDYGRIMPDKMYLRLEILYQDQNYVLIRYNTDKEFLGNNEVQLLKTDGSLVFTFKIPQEEDKPVKTIASNGILHKDGILIETNY